jgi:heme/copper-type cytochrome/quinol oxidase subunit 2
MSAIGDKPSVAGIIWGAATAGTAANQETIVTVLGIPLTQLALIVGILGVIGNLIFQILYYRDSRKDKTGQKEQESDKHEAPQSTNKNNDGD